MAEDTPIEVVPSEILKDRWKGFLKDLQRLARVTAAPRGYRTTGRAKREWIEEAKRLRTEVTEIIIMTARESFKTLPDDERVPTAHAVLGLLSNPPPF